MKTFHVSIKSGATVRASFEAMGASKVAVQQQHECLCADGEQAVVHTSDEWLQRIDACPKPDITDYSSNKFRKYAAMEEAANNRSDYFGGDRS